MTKEINRDEMEELLDDGAQLVDVREEEELEGGAIEGHVHVPLSEFEDHSDLLAKDRPIIFYCRSGRRSLKAAELAESLGFSQDLYSLKGGYVGYTGEDD